jgi:hypothetical protein
LKKASAQSSDHFPEVVVNSCSQELLWKDLKKALAPASDYFAEVVVNASWSQKLLWKDEERFISIFKSFS